MKRIALSLLLCCSVYFTYAQKAPSAVKVEALSTTAIGITWKNNETDATTIIERSHDGKTYTKVVELTNGETSYTDEGLGIGAVCGYRLQAKKGTTTSQQVKSDIITTKNKRFAYNLAAMPGKIADVQYDNHDRPTELSPSAFDDDHTTKYYFNGTNGWMRVRLDKAYRAQAYTVVSANDHAERDPKSWVLKAANNAGGPWTTLDTRTDVIFPTRFLALTFEIADETPYKFFQLDILSNISGGAIQLAEFKIWGERNAQDIAQEEIKAPTNLQATVLAHHLANLTWEDKSNNETAFRIERSSDGGKTWELQTEVAKNYTGRYAATLKGSTSYQFRVRAENKYKQSAWATSNTITTPSSEIPQTITEHCGTPGQGGHDEVVKLVYKGNHTAIYYDDNMNANITWPFALHEKAWEYCKEVYGDYSDPYLTVIFHAENYSGGHPAGFSNRDHDYRNLTDNGAGRTVINGAWQSINDLGIPIHEISHIMEGCSHHMDGSPEAWCWGDSKFAEVFIYDVLVNLSALKGDPLGLKPVLTRELPVLMNNNDWNNDNDPARLPKGSYWFRDFWYPMYTNHGGNKMLGKFFELMYAHWPKKNNNYIGTMNYGDLFHFYSGACDFDVTPYVTKAFGFSDEHRYQYRYAQIAYPMPYCMDEETGIDEMTLPEKNAFPSILNGELNVYDITGQKVLTHKCNNEVWSHLKATLDLPAKTPYICIFKATDGTVSVEKAMSR